MIEAIDFMMAHWIWTIIVYIIFTEAAFFGFALDMVNWGDEQTTISEILMAKFFSMLVGVIGIMMMTLLVSGAIDLYTTYGNKVIYSVIGVIAFIAANIGLVKFKEKTK